MKEASIPFRTEAVNWEAIPRLPIAEPLRCRDTEAKAWARICRTEDALLLQMGAERQEVRREETGPLGMPCFDSCLEFFFCPEETDLRYLNLEWNAVGCHYLGFGSGPEDHMRIVQSSDACEALFAPEITIREDGWALQFRVPFALIRRFFPGWQPQAGKAIRANFYNCGDQLQTPHYLCWNPICREGAMLFHTPSQFGLLRFE